MPSSASLVRPACSVTPRPGGGGASRGRAATRHVAAASRKRRNGKSAPSQSPGSEDSVDGGALQGGRDVLITAEADTKPRSKSQTADAVAPEHVGGEEKDAGAGAAGPLPVVSPEPFTLHPKPCTLP